jgi:hypothetical protein
LAYPTRGHEIYEDEPGTEATPDRPQVAASSHPLSPGKRKDLSPQVGVPEKSDRIEIEPVAGGLDELLKKLK